MLKGIPSWQLKKFFKKGVTLTKYSYSDGEDAYGQKSKTTTGTYTLEAEIQEIRSEDLAYMRPGLVELGDAWGFFLPSYTKKGKTVTVEIGDEVTWNSKTWRVDYIENYITENNVTYKRALLKRVI